MSSQLPSFAAALLLAAGVAAAQQPAATPAPASDAAPVASAPAQPAPATHPAPEASSKHGKKEVYTGPTEIVVLAPTPMLDEEGRQRVDPDGKPMFNAPVKQQRDKKGHPLFDEAGKPVFQTATELGYDEKGHKLHAEKIKPPKATRVDIARGTFTVDGVIGKAELNYEIADLKFLYFYVPGNGVTVVSNEPFPGAKQQPNAFNENTLTVKADDHVLQLASDRRLLDKKPQPAYVLVDRTFNLPTAFPAVGYGSMVKAPYQWPGSHANKQLTGVGAPPVPRDLEPVLLLKPCPAGQMRIAATRTDVPATEQSQPCVPMAQAEHTLKAQTPAPQPPLKTSFSTVPQMPAAAPSSAPAARP